MTNEELLASMMLGWIGFNTLPLARVRIDNSRMPSGCGIYTLEVQMTKEELEENKKIRELSKKYKGCRCSQYCSIWNSEDRDCEIMGSYHLSPSRCRWFLLQKLHTEGGKIL